MYLRRNGDLVVAGALPVARAGVLLGVLGHVLVGVLGHRTVT